MNYEPIVKEILESKTKDGSLEKVISKHVDNTIEEVVSGLFRKSYNDKENGPCYDIIQKAISPILIKCLGECDLTAMAEKTLAAINQVVMASAMKRLGDNTASLLDIFAIEKRMPYGSQITLKDLFDKYVKDIVEEYYGFDKDWFEKNDKYYHDDYVGSVECNVVVSDYEESLCCDKNKYKVLRFEVDLDPNTTEYKDLCVEAIIHKDWNGRWHINSSHLLDMRISDLDQYKSFQVYLALLAMQSVEIIDIQGDSQTATFEHLEDE